MVWFEGLATSPARQESAGSHQVFDQVENPDSLPFVCISAQRGVPCGRPLLDWIEFRRSRVPSPVPLYHDSYASENRYSERSQPHCRPWNLSASTTAWASTLISTISSAAEVQCCDWPKTPASAVRIETCHEQFWISLDLILPILALSPMLHSLLGLLEELVRLNEYLAEVSPKAASAEVKDIQARGDGIRCRRSSASGQSAPSMGRAAHSRVGRGV